MLTSPVCGLHWVFGGFYPGHTLGVMSNYSNFGLVNYNCHFANASNFLKLFKPWLSIICQWQ